VKWSWLRRRTEEGEFPLKAGTIIEVWNEVADESCQSLSTPYMVFYF
jgi:hypothetical protein